MIQAILIIFLLGIGIEVLAALLRLGFSFLQVINLIPDNLALNRMSALNYANVIAGIFVFAFILLNILHYMGVIDLKSLFKKDK